jgi:hypothetical protein
MASIFASRQETRHAIPIFAIARCRGNACQGGDFLFRQHTERTETGEAVFKMISAPQTLNTRHI